MIPCTLRQLEIFVAAAEDCHFVRTANRLGISQPAVTSHIRTLEEELGTPLFIRRKGSTPILSQEGAALLNQAQAFVAQGKKIYALKDKGKEAEGAQVGICAGGHILDDVIRPKLSGFYKRHPNIALELRYAGSTAEGARSVQRGLVDFFVHTVENPAAFDLDYEIVRDVVAGVYGGPDFRKFRHAFKAEISELPFILPLKGSPQDIFVQNFLREAGIVCSNVVARTQYHHVMLDMVKSGDGLAVLFDTMMPEALDHEEVIRLDDDLPMMRRCIFRRGADLPPAAQATQEFLQDVLSE